MATYQFNCPHCSSTRVSSKISWLKYVPESVLRSDEAPYAYFVVECTACSSPSLFRATDNRYVVRAHFPSFANEIVRLSQLDHTIVTEYLRVVRFDAVLSSDIPEHLSTAVAKAYRAAEKNFRLPDCEDAAATMYRRSIDVAIRELYPDVTGNLAPRISRLVEVGAIPSQMRDWADHIRWIGNEGAHEPEGVVRSDLEVLRKFTEAFLTYVVTMPFKVRLARGLISADGTDAS